jgi:hypothetical protein
LTTSVWTHADRLLAFGSRLWALSCGLEINPHETSLLTLRAA